MHIEPTVMYAIPRKGFFPPSHEAVDNINRFLPLKGITGKSVLICS